jgi:hypothetical protein
MALPYGFANNDVIQITTTVNYRNQLCLNTYHYRYTGTPVSDAEPDLVALNVKFTALGGSVGRALQESINSDAVLIRLAYQKIWPIRQQAFVINADGAGLAVGDGPHPTNTAAVISRYTAIAGRGRTGSLHVPATLQSNLTDAGLWSAGYIATLQALATQLPLPIAALTSATNWIPGLFQLGDPSTFNVLTTTVVRNTPRVMRRRTIGVGI